MVHKVETTNKGLTRYQKLAVIRENSDFCSRTLLHTKHGCTNAFIEIYHDVKLFRCGYTNDMYSPPQSLVYARVTSIRQIRDVVGELLTYGFQDIDDETMIDFFPIDDKKEMC